MEPQKYLTKEQVLNLIKNAPQGVTPQAIVKDLVEKRGYTLEGLSVPKPVAPLTKPEERRQDVQQTIAGMGQTIERGIQKTQDITEAYKQGEQGALATGFQKAGVGAQTVSRLVFGDALKGLVKLALPQESEDKLKEKVKAVAFSAMETLDKYEKLKQESPLKAKAVNIALGYTPEAVLGIEDLFKGYQKLQETNSPLARNLDATLGFASLATDLFGVGVGGAGVKAGAKQVGTIAKEGAEATADLVKQGISGTKALVEPVSDRVAKTIGKFNPKDQETSIKLIKDAYQAGFIDDAVAVNRQLDKIAKSAGKTSDELVEDLVRAGIAPQIDGKISDFTVALSELENKSKQYRKIIRESASKYTEPTDLEEFKKAVLSEIEETADPAELLRARDELNRTIENYRAKYKGDILLPEYIDEIRVSANAKTKAFDRPIFEQDVSSAIGEVARRRMDEIIPDELYKKANAELQKLINLQRTAMVFNRKPIKVNEFITKLGSLGGTIGLGTAIGGAVSGQGALVIAGIFAQLGANAVAKYLRKNLFNKKALQIIREAIKQEPSIVDDLLKDASKADAKEIRKLLPAPKEGAPKVRLESGETINLPAKSQTSRDMQEQTLLQQKLRQSQSYTPLNTKKVKKSIPNRNAGFISTGYKGEKELTTKILKDLEGKTTVSKQYILDATNRGELKQVERDLFRDILATEKSDTINVSDFAKKVKAELLPLKVTKNKDLYTGNNYGTKYENITLPSELRGNVKNYRENVYESPVKTSAGNTHFSEQGKQGYFGHTRIEDMADNKTRRVIEVQSDLYQKGNLDKEKVFVDTTPHSDRLRKDLRALMERKNQGMEVSENRIKDLQNQLDNLDEKAKTESTRAKEVAKLQQYNDPTAHFRMVREEIKKAAQDGKTKLQFPTGETIMKIEKLGSEDAFVFHKSGSYLDESNYAKLQPNDMEVGKQILMGDSDGSKYIITEVLGDGKFKAMSKEHFDSFAESKGLDIQGEELVTYAEHHGTDNFWRSNEEFDVSGKMNESNPIYRFYEKDMQKYLNKFGGKRVVDDKGVSWIEVPIKKEYGDQAVEAFGKSQPNVLMIGAGLSAGIVGGAALKKKLKK